MVLLDFVILPISLFLIVIVSKKVIEYASMIAKIYGLSEMAAGFLLLSIATSLPELTVSIIAALQNEGGLAFGNVLGSNIANITIILSLGMLISGTVAIEIKKDNQKQLITFLFITSVIPLIVIQRGSLSLMLGIILLIMFVYFSFSLSKETAPEIKALQPVKAINKVSTFAKFIFFIFLIVIISTLIVQSSINIATYFDVPPSIIGATIIGLGTSLPELTTTVQALKKNSPDMALGNLLGSNITNMTLILGASALFAYSPVNITAVTGLLFFVLISTLFLWYLITTKGVISKKSAYIMIVIYMVFILQSLEFSIFIF